MRFSNAILSARRPVGPGIAVATAWVCGALNGPCHESSGVRPPEDAPIQRSLHFGGIAGSADLQDDMQAATFGKGAFQA